MRVKMATLGRQGYSSAHSWAKPFFLPLLSSANTATWPLRFSKSITVTSANSLLLVTETAVGSLDGGKRKVGSLPLAVQVPAVATKPDGKMMTPQFAQPPMPRAAAIGVPGLPPASRSHFCEV